MSGELAVRAATLPEKIQYARAMADAQLLPPHYRKQPANLLIALEYAEAFGISPINAINSVFVIEGKPSASADLIAALVRRAGHRLRVVGDDEQATATLIRCDDPEFEYTATWDLGKAKQAGLLGKATWKTYPGALLRARAITEVARMGASDALFGVIYTPEELNAAVDEEGRPVIDALPVEESGRDWSKEAHEQVTVDGLRELWRECSMWGELTDELKAEFEAVVVALTPGEPEPAATHPEGENDAPVVGEGQEVLPLDSEPLDAA